MLVLLLGVCCLLFAGCSIVDPDDLTDDDGGGSGGGSSPKTAEIVPNKFKLGYRGTADDDTAKRNISDLAAELVTDFASTYGAGNGYIGNQNDYYYDSIRYQIILGKNADEEDYVFADKSFAWKWSSNNLSNTPFRYIQTEGKPLTDFAPETYYSANVSGKTRLEIYQTFYKTLYSEAMETVLYEILLGRTDYKNMIVVSSSFDSNGYPTVTYRGKSIGVVGGKLDFSNVLLGLKNEYFDKATYFGFSLEDGKKIKDYIINYVIGSNALSDTDGNDQLNANRNYRAYVTNLVDELIKPETKYYWHSRTGFKDGRLAISSTGDYFQLVPKAEYQSLVLMQEEADEFSFCWIAFQSSRDLKIKMYFRYYDGQTIKTTTPKTIEVLGGKYDMIDHDMSDMDFGTGSSQCFALDVFDNNEFVAAPTARSNNSATEIYKPIASQNGFGSVSVFNEAKVKSSFLEIVLDVEKNVNDPIGTDYSFQVALFSLVFKSDLDSNTSQK